ncbi:hypothetical protein ALC57_10129 [Trachymyrmex cornetzi]|uniref:SWIM-type domain-containing protein n=1 Tax=Trachymyrmex cornetzi TaxID=471704 RepID=A0A151J4M9_9HYME|nr:hypothetical protein ALC57_10129 [Trachymyrmex cornetzi]
MDGDENVNKRQIAITRRDEFDHPPLHLDDNSRLCINCNRSIIDEMAMIEADPTCVRLNVLTQTASQTCVICNVQNNVRRLSIQCRVQVFIETNIYIPDNVRSCENHLDENGFFSKILLPALPPISKQQFEELFTYCDPVLQNGKLRYVSRKDLLVFLCKMRQGLSDDFLKVIFDYPSRQTVTIAVIDSTYAYIHKSNNFRVLRQSYSVHKHRHLVKPTLIVASDGYILTIFGPYFSDAQNNDAEILCQEFERDAETLQGWFQNGDIVLVDRGYRDAIPLLQRLGIDHKMPALLERGQRQLSTQDANDSRIVTKNRWVVEARNGHLRSVFKFLAQTINLQHTKNLNEFYCIAGAILNRYHPIIQMQNADPELAREMLQRSTTPNVVQARVEVDNLRLRNAQWRRLNYCDVADFPIFDLNYLKDLTVGIYQINLASSYIQDKLLRDNDEEFQLDQHFNEPGFLRIRLYSRFRNATRHQIFISYETDNRDDENAAHNLNEPINGYYCTCQSGARTLGTCAHVASVLWYLGFARHQENIKYPDMSLLNTVLDAADREIPHNP